MSVTINKNEGDGSGGGEVITRFTLRNKRWSYRGEGNANLVLSLVEEGSVLRLKKFSPGEPRQDRMRLEMEFCRRLMRPLLGESLVPVPVAVCLPVAEMADIDDVLRSQRPPARRHGRGLSHTEAALFPDLCLLPADETSAPTYCVEVKPKQGWIPIPDRRLPKCTFCLNQYLKLRRGLVGSLSTYCPLDLFSGDRYRMKRAVRSLLTCPQNNFKMFKNGSLVYDDRTPGNYESVLEEWFGGGDSEMIADAFADLVVDALMSEEGGKPEKELDSPVCVMSPSQEPKRKVGAASGPWMPDAPLFFRVPQSLVDEARSLLPGPPCYQDAGVLPGTCVLSRILSVQKLDAAGADRVYHLYKSRGRSDDYDYLYEMFSSPRSTFEPLNSYLLSTTAKDCSILMAFRRAAAATGGSLRRIKGFDNVYYCFNIGLTDLDPKPASCIEKHKKRDIDAVVACVQFLRSKP